MGEPWSHLRAQEDFLREPKGPWNTLSVLRSRGNALGRKESSAGGWGDAVISPTSTRHFQRLTVSPLPGIGKSPYTGVWQDPAHEGCQEASKI